MEVISLKSNPKKVIIENIEYPINTDFRIAIECNSISQIDNISDFEKALAIIYKLFGEKGLKARNHWNDLIELGQKYLLCGKNVDEINQKELTIDMDIVEDEGYIKSSFRQDYGYNPYELEYLHWYDFVNDLANLSNSEFGNCCILSRIRNLRTYDTSKIKDNKERAKIEEAKNSVALKNTKFKKFSQEQNKNITEFLEQLKK